MEKRIKIWFIIATGLLCWSNIGMAEEPSEKLCIASTNPKANDHTNDEIADELGWLPADNRCGGYYLEQPFFDPEALLKNKDISVTGKEGVFSLHGTSIYQGHVTITQDGQQIITRKAYLYRDPTTGKFSGIDLIGDVNFRKPNTLIVARCGHVDLTQDTKTLNDILYRTAIYGVNTTRPTVTALELQHERKVFQLSAWGKAESFKQEEPQVYQFHKASYSTCPPLNTAWQVKADDITLNKITGRGVAKNARLLIRDVPVLYAPYLNFPIDARRQTGFLWPKAGSSSVTGPYLATPFYWNLAPNYDDTITPAVLGKRGLQVTNLFRYLNASPPTAGELQLTILPDDKYFASFQNSQEEEYGNTTDPATRAELNRLENASTTRGAVSWQNQTRFNSHWSSAIDYNWVSDDYYLKDFSNNLNVITLNQILQEGDLYYKSQFWNFTGRVQAYQTLHPINENIFYNQYMRVPQLVLNGNYPNPKTGLDFFVLNDLTNFDINKNPANINPDGVTTLPIGTRINIQPGISYPVFRPSFFISPRLQFAATRYQLDQTEEYSNDPSRTVPIFDVFSGLYFDRETTLFSHPFRQTLEPQFYYTYIPYRDQMDIPIFDTTLNTLTYDQLFTYNRFSGLDRIGDANQISVGLTTRFIDKDSGIEKMNAGVGQILYFKDRQVTLCSIYNTNCDEIEDSAQNTERRSPLSAVFSYNVNPNWSAKANAIWDSQAQQLNNQTLTIQYLRDLQHIVNLSYSFVRDGDPQKFINTEESEDSTNNLWQTDLTFSWPVTRDWSAVGRWTENWNSGSLQNLLYGLQYDSCCWTIRVVAGKTFTNITNDNSYQYNTEFFLQFALKGLGNFGTGNPGQALNNSAISSQTNFGMDY